MKTYRTPCNPPPDGFYWSTCRGDAESLQVVRVDRYTFAYGEEKQVEIEYIGTDDYTRWEDLEAGEVFIGPLWPPAPEEVT